MYIKQFFHHTDSELFILFQYKTSSIIENPLLHNFTFVHSFMTKVKSAVSSTVGVLYYGEREHVHKNGRCKYLGDWPHGESKATGYTTVVRA